jgi:4-deoxy-L-threo-5-hexosulose-uronate ketol-isomerase
MQPISILEAISSREAATMNTAQLRENFLMESLIEDNAINFVYTHYDRMVVGGVKPTNQTINLGNYDNLKSSFFLERRELGIINVAGTGKVNADGTTFEVSKLGCVYLGKGTKNVTFESNNPDEPAVFFLLSSPAHQEYPNQHFSKEEAAKVNLGSGETCNQRTIYKYIHNDGIKSCQLVMGLTVLETGSIWNTMPAHTHDRRMEAYFYFDVPENQAVFHFMGQPQETRHLLVHNHQAVLSPPWSIHSGAGTANYSFIWGMAGENKEFVDMDAVAIVDIR